MKKTFAFSARAANGNKTAANSKSVAAMQRQICRARGTSTCPTAEMRVFACGLVSGVVGEKAQWRNAASGHKMFIAAGSDFSGDKVMVRGGESAETRTAAQTGGGSCRCYADEDVVGLKSSGK